ncbi:porin [Shewanella schlegeliana]|uniref:Porin n=1 Tax=Shewanella schlegeliana TaxID=190308 RepID=A0ABS1SVT5_9GAMM|nr:porin [Shewanella schlegeliana]MBL4912519.1 porin [Shewanella schlegeliana]MCL1108011.1 porin [Shewanella schlegeliana]GIU21411.1 porin [Shewanella schlegeliana]
MKKALAIFPLATMVLMPSAFAVEIYKDDKNSIGIGGYIDARIIDTQGQTQVVNGSSRVNIGFTREMSDDWKAFTKLEWGVNPFGDTSLSYSSESFFETTTDNFLSNRLGYVGVSHDKLGSLAIGKQWGAWYDVVYNTNYGFVWDGNASGTYTYQGDGSFNGTGRADKAVQYRNSFGMFSFALQVQLKDDSFDVIEPVDQAAAMVTAPTTVTHVEYNYTYGAGLTLDATDRLTFTAGANFGEFKARASNGSRLTETDYVYGGGVTWGAWDDQGFYAALNANQQEYHDTDNLGRMIPDATGLESLFSYLFEGDFKVFLSYNILKAGDEYEAAYNGDIFERESLVAGGHYIWNNSVIFYLEGRKDLSNFDSTNKAQEELMGKPEDDGVAIGVRFII